MKFWSTSLIILVFVTQSIAQQKHISRGNQQWFQYYNQLKINEKWFVLNDVGYRWKNGFEESKQYIVRTGLGYAINTSVRVSGGFAHLGFLDHNRVNTFEFRPYQEARVKIDFRKLIITHRYRLEERLMKPLINNEIQSSYSIRFRFRYGIYMKFSVLRLSKSNPDRRLLLIIGNELHVNLGDNIDPNYFDQNRIIISPTVHLNKTLSVSLAWNSQFASTSIPDGYNYTDVFWLQLKHNIALHH